MLNPNPTNLNEIIYGTTTPFVPENRIPERTVYVITPEQTEQIRREQEAAKRAREAREARADREAASRTWDQIDADVSKSLSKSLENILAPYRIAPEIAVADPRSVGSWGPGTGTSRGGQYGVFGLPLEGAAKLAEAGQQGMNAGDKWFMENVMQPGADAVSNYANRFGIELSPEAMEAASLGTGALMGLASTGGRKSAAAKAAEKAAAEAAAKKAAEEAAAAAAAAKAAARKELGRKVLKYFATALGFLYAGQAVGKVGYNLWSSPNYYDIDTGVLNNILGSAGVEVLGHGKNATAMLTSDMISKLAEDGAITIRNAWDPVLEGRTRIVWTNNFTPGQIANPFSWSPKQPLERTVGYGNNAPTLADTTKTVDLTPPPKRPPSGGRGSGGGNTVSGNRDNTAEPYTGEAGAITSSETKPIVPNPSQ